MAAIEKASEVLAKKGNDPMEQAELYYTRGAIYWVLSQPEKALAAWETALTYNPQHAQAREWVGVAQAAALKKP